MRRPHNSSLPITLSLKKQVFSILKITQTLSKISFNKTGIILKLSSRAHMTIKLKLNTKRKTLTKLKENLTAKPVNKGFKVVLRIVEIIKQS